MRKYSDLMSEALRKNRERVETLYAFQSAIHAANMTIAEYENEDGIAFITISYPDSGDDYMLITIYLSEKGKIVKDVGSFIDDFRHLLPGLEFKDDIYTDAVNQTKTWDMRDRGAHFVIDGVSKNPRVVVRVDASKSTTCKRVPTGEMVPVYEFICEEA